MPQAAEAGRGLQHDPALLLCTGAGALCFGVLHWQRDAFCSLGRQGCFMVFMQYRPAFDNVAHTMFHCLVPSHHCAMVGALRPVCIMSLSSALLPGLESAPSTHGSLTNTLPFWFKTTIHITRRPPRALTRVLHSSHPSWAVSLTGTRPSTRATTPLLRYGLLLTCYACRSVLLTTTPWPECFTVCVAQA